MELAISWREFCQSTQSYYNTNNNNLFLLLKRHQDVFNVSGFSDLAVLSHDTLQATMRRWRHQAVGHIRHRFIQSYLHNENHQALIGTSCQLLCLRRTISETIFLQVVSWIEAYIDARSWRHG